MDFAPLVQGQRAFFQSGATRPLEFRRQQLQRLQAALEQHEEALLQALHDDLRKPPHEAYASELGLVHAEIRHALRHLPAWIAPRRRRAPLIAWPGRALTRPEPRGVALIIGPWNYPLQLLLSPLVAAIAAGNCAILKPSEFAPHTADTLHTLIRDAFPPHYLTLVPGERDVAEALLRERFDTLFFTGSTPVGRAVMAAAARHLTPVTLELGGKCPVIVGADAPLELTARRIAWGKFLNAGQTCVAPDFLLVDRRIESGLVAALQRAITAFYGDNPRQSPDYGRIIHRRHWDRLTGYLSQGRAVHGGDHHAEDLYLAPTLLADAPPDSPVMQEEIFGPILPVVPVDGLDDAIHRLRDRPTPLALYLFTRDRTAQQRVLDSLPSGGVCLNDTVSHMVGAQLPFGGLGESGMGAYHGRAGFDCFTHHRSILRRSLAVDLPFRYPPPRVPLATLKRAFRFLLGS